MFDGMNSTLINESHIPSMCKNLISFEELDFNGFKWSIDNEVLSVMNGSHIFMRSSHEVEKFIHLGGNNNLWRDT